ncbi:hypothetical protein [Salipaludibacillus keqinensis]|nr:hypothetical protein [Salipaludibacillus keqinensis]
MPATTDTETHHGITVWIDPSAKEHSHRLTISYTNGKIVLTDEKS